jgi:hypothetical protein
MPGALENVRSKRSRNCRREAATSRGFWGPRAGGGGAPASMVRNPVTATLRPASSISKSSAVRPGTARPDLSVTNTGTATTRTSTPNTGGDGTCGSAGLGAPASAVTNASALAVGLGLMVDLPGDERWMWDASIRCPPTRGCDHVAPSVGCTKKNGPGVPPGAG